MKNNIRAIRRRELSIRYKRTKRLHSVRYSDKIEHVTIMKLLNNYSICSCPYCRNERTNKCLKCSDRLTIQERKQNEKYKYEVLSIRE